MSGRAWRNWLPSLVVASFVACSLSNLDDLKGDEADAGTGGSDAKCTAGVDCTGCPTCAYFCACIAGPNVLQCMAGCQDSGLGGSSSGGTTGSGGGGGTAGMAAGGVAGTAGATGCSPGPNCVDCCAVAEHDGAQQYSDMIYKCICQAGALCASACDSYCQGGTATQDCTDCFQQDATQTCIAAECSVACQAFVSCISPCYGA